MVESESLLHPRFAKKFYGNQRLESEIFQTLNSPRMHHAWIFHGPKGIGKSTMAYRVARYFLGATPDGKSLLSTSVDDKISKQIENESCPDLKIASHYCPQEEKEKSVVSVYAIREMNTLFLRRANNEFGRRIAIIEDADDMNENAANALLKTLEEPPAGGLIILIVNSLGSILPTIRSRCRLFEFRPMKFKELRILLPNASHAALALSGGAYGNALRLMEFDVDRLYQDFCAAIGAFPKQNHAASWKFAAFATDNEKSDIAFNLINNWLQRASRAAIGITIDEIEPGESANMARIASAFNENQWYEISQRIAQMRLQIDTNLDRVSAVLNVLNSFFPEKGMK